MELKDTISMMTSDDYKERFKAEYHQLKLRTKKLSAMLNLWDIGALHFTPVCPREILEKQLSAMIDYLAILALRADEEEIDLSEETIR